MIILQISGMSVETMNNQYEHNGTIMTNEHMVSLKKCHIYVLESHSHIVG